MLFLSSAVNFRQPLIIHRKNVIAFTPSLSLLLLLLFHWICACCRSENEISYFKNYVTSNQIVSSNNLQLFRTTTCSRRSTHTHSHIFLPFFLSLSLSPPLWSMFTWMNCPESNNLHMTNTFCACLFRRIFPCSFHAFLR